ncbi:MULTISPECIES: DUF2798 domain-containing protein [Pseudomonas]|nr:DUF2798 domain-containing protein [Pseudomonas sp. Y24-6]
MRLSRGGVAAMPSAFVCVMVVGPMVARLVAWTVHAR